jgi:hypothetical protein
MDIPTGSFERLMSRLESYINTSIELAKLKLVAAFSLASANLLAGAITIFIALVALLFCSFGTALWLGEWLGKIYYGFFAMAGFYLLLSITLGLIVKKHFSKGISNYLIRKLMK